MRAVPGEGRGCSSTAWGVQGWQGITQQRRQRGEVCQHPKGQGSEVEEHDPHRPH